MLALVERDARRAFLGAGVRVDRPPRIDVLQVVNRPGQIVVRVRWHTRPATGFVVPMDERWVIGLRDGRP